MISPSPWHCGVDEAGRGCIAGMVVAAAVIFPDHYTNPLIDDSKQLSEKQRLLARKEIERDATACAIGTASVEEIDTHNILQATYLAMHRAITALAIKPQHIDVDGKYFKAYPSIPHRCFIQGDQTHIHIAAASILAKTERDRYMQNLHTLFPMYDWKKNKGYPTPKHIDAVRQHGRSIHHRTSFHIPI